MPPIRAGQMRSRVILQARDTVGDGQGGTSHTWAEVAILWARVVPADLSGDAAEAHQTVSRRRYTVTIRRRDVTSAMRLVRAAQILEIQSVIDSDDLRDAIVLECREVPA